MSKYINKVLICNICGKSHEYNVLRALSVFKSELDGYTGNSDLYATVLECPYCHNVNEDITAEVSKKEKEIILSDKYQKAFSDDRDTVLRRFTETAKRKTAVRKWLAAAHYWQLAGWRARDLGDCQEAEYQSHAIDSIKNALIDDEPVQMKHMCVLVDLLRQAGRFDEAEYYAESCIEVIEKGNAMDEEEYKVFKQEIKLIREKDSLRHAYEGE